MQILHIPLILRGNEIMVQYGNMQYTNIVVNKEEKSNFCLLKVAIVGGRLRLRLPKQNFEGTRSPRPPYNRRP